MEWHGKTSGWGYTKESVEAHDNATLIYGYLASKGWTLNAVCALLGSIDVEGLYNPWQWENDQPLASTDTYLIEHSAVHGYGLIGFTPSGNYINSPISQSSPYYAPHFSDIMGSPSDGYAQLLFIDEWEHTYYPSPEYPMTYAEFKSSTADVRYLALVWTDNAENPAMDRPPEDPGFLNRRQDAAAYWYRELGGVDPPGPGPGPSPSIASKMPLWFYLKKIF